MKRFTSLLYIFVAIALVKSTTGKVAGNVAVSTECTIVAEQGRSIDDELHERAQVCFRKIGHYELTGNPPTEDEIREAVRAFCRKGPELTRCLDKARSDADACSLSETQRTEFRLSRQQKELEHEVGCVRNGEDLATITVIISELENDFVAGCMANATDLVVSADTQEPNGFMLREYRVFQTHRECLEGHRGRGHDSTIATVTSMATQTMDRMKCNQNGTDVLCKTIITN